MASSFFANITGTIMEPKTIKEDDNMLMVGITLVLIGVFLIGKASND